MSGDGENDNYNFNFLSMGRIVNLKLMDLVAKRLSFYRITRRDKIRQILGMCDETYLFKNHRFFTRNINCFIF
jgi:hypothetical protein